MPHLHLQPEVLPEPLSSIHAHSLVSPLQCPKGTANFTIQTLVPDLPSQVCSFQNLLHLSCGLLYPSICSGQKPWCHHLLTSSFHTPRPVGHSSFKRLPESSHFSSSTAILWPKIPSLLTWLTNWSPFHSPQDSQTILLELELWLKPSRGPYPKACKSDVFNDLYLGLPLSFSSTPGHLLD